MCVRVVGGEGGGELEIESACYRFLSFSFPALLSFCLHPTFDVLAQVELNNPLETFSFKDVDDYADEV